MDEILKGNFATKKKVIANKKDEGMSAKFEREALKRLGGSIAFVSKKQFLFGMKEEGGNAPKGG